MILDDPQFEERPPHRFFGAGIDYNIPFFDAALGAHYAVVILPRGKVDLGH